MQNRINELDCEASILDISDQFDDDLYELYVKKGRISLLHETLHHILSRASIDKFINKLKLDEKKEILLTFVRYTPNQDNDVTQEEYERIQKGTDKPFITSMLGRGLKSLRSNLTFGQEKRSDDPKGKADNFDANYELGTGEMDEISTFYREASFAIEKSHHLAEGKERDAAIGTVVEGFQRAETALAGKQVMLICKQVWKRAILQTGQTCFPAQHYLIKIK